MIGVERASVAISCRSSHKMTGLLADSEYMLTMMCAVSLVLFYHVTEYRGHKLQLTRSNTTELDDKRGDATLYVAA